MICPHCKGELVLRGPAWHNVETYRRPAKVFTICCQQPIYLSLVTSFRAVPTEINGADDWGWEQDDERKCKDL